ncbi:MAG: DUF2171 domain-containing protein [Sphingobium sp.]
MPEANIIKPHMEVIGSDGVHVGTIDSIEDARIKLTKSGSDDGKHHFVDKALVQDIRGDTVTLTAPGSSVDTSA